MGGNARGGGASPESRSCALKSLHVRNNAMTKKPSMAAHGGPIVEAPSSSG